MLQNVVDYPPLMSVRLPPDDGIFGSNQNLWGNGYTYARWLPRDFGGYTNGMSPARIEALIREKAFDLVIFGSPRRGTPFFYEVMSAYGGGTIGDWFTAQQAPVKSIILIDAEDESGWTPFAAVRPHPARACTDKIT